MKTIEQRARESVKTHLIFDGKSYEMNAIWTTAYIDMHCNGQEEMLTAVLEFLRSEVACQWDAPCSDDYADMIYAHFKGEK